MSSDAKAKRGIYQNQLAICEPKQQRQENLETYGWAKIIENLLVGQFGTFSRDVAYNLTYGDPTYPSTAVQWADPNVDIPGWRIIAHP